MEGNNDNDINFLPKPNFNTANLNYIVNQKNVYVNLFEVILHKDLKLYQYPYAVTPEIEAGDLRIRDKIFKTVYKKLKNYYGECFISGDSLYGMKKVDEVKEVQCKIFLKGATEYTVTLQKCANEKTIKQQDVQRDPLTKQFIEILVRDILHANPDLEFYKGLFVLKSREKKIETDRVSIKFYPGYTTSFMETDGGNYLNVTLKNKIIGTDTILDVLKMLKYTDKRNQDDIKDKLIGRSFKVSYAKKNYRIDDILFDRNPKNQTFNHEGQSKKLVDYYEEAHKLKIKDLNQPLIVVKKKNSDGEEIYLYFIPELCYLAGLDDNDTKDGQFMKELANYTKLLPDDRVNKTNEFLNLLVETKKPEDGNLSAKEKSDLYGIEIKPLDKLFKAHYMEETKLIGGGGKPVKASDRTFPVLEKIDMTSWICVYEKSNYSDAENLFNTLSKASKAYKINIAEPEWVEMPNRASARDWTDTVDDYIGKGKNDYSFVVFLLGKNDRMYQQLKKHSLCRNGYVSQVVKARSIQKKGAMSVCSKILLQINAKLRGVSYKTDVPKQILERKLMVVGVDSSHIKGQRTGVAMVATMNDSFTDFFNKEDIIKEENKEQLTFCVSSFLEEAIAAFNKENKKTPKNIIIYRQGVSLQQKEYLKEEIKQIEKTCNTNNVNFYYILVNTKTTYKFFEKSKGHFNNPGAGLLVIEGITNRNFFEFYIQPQEVTGGSATPSCFHVAYGDMNFPEMIPKFTYDLCHIYSNWQGTVRIPNVIKAAEKLSKMTAKYTLDSLNDNLKLGQAYL